MNLDGMFHNGMDPYATVGAVLHVPYGSCKLIIMTNFKMFYVLREFYVGDDLSVSFDILYCSQVLWELF